MKTPLSNGVRCFLLIAGDQPNQLVDALIAVELSLHFFSSGSPESELQILALDQVFYAAE